MGESERIDYSTTRYWEHLVFRSPAEALDEVERLLAAGVLHDDALALAHGAAGRCLFEIGRVDEARSAADRALAAALGASREVRTWVAMGASVVLAEAGRIEPALQSLEELADGSDGVDLGRIRVQIAYVLQHTGRLNEALDEFDRSEQLFSGNADPGDRLRLHHNRGLVLLQQGRLEAADSDFRAAERIAQQMQMVSAQAQSVANRAVLLGRARLLAESVEEFGRAGKLFSSAGSPSRPVAIMAIDQAEVMMHSGLLADAVAAGRTAVETVEPTGNVMLLGDALMIAARTELAAGLLRGAVSSARRAEAAFSMSDRTHMVPHAQSIVAQAELIGARTPEAAADRIDEAAQVATALRSSGWADQADDLCLARVRAAHRWHLGAAARGDLERLRVGVADGRRDTALAGWWTEALARRMDDNATSAVEACHAGLSVLDEILAEAPSLEQRSAAMRMGNDLSQLLIELAIERGDADTVLAAAEGTRGRALHDELADRRRYRPLTRDGADDLRRELSVRLDDRTLVEWVVARERVWAVVFDSNGRRLVDVADRRAVMRARDHVLVWLDRAAAEPDESSTRALRAAQLLDDILIQPLGLPPDSGIVLVPVGALHGIPWAGLPSLADRPMALTPNAQVWLDADRRAAGATDRVGLVLGPGVNGIDLEQVAVEQSHPSVAIAAGDGATATAVASMLGRCDIVHIAAHGTFRSDHPLLSTLRLHDGEATMYDVVPGQVHSKLVILSSCEGGAQGTADGSEVLGLSAVLLARGAAAVLAPLTVVRELECAEFVADVHGELAAGETFACAVAAVRHRWLADDDLSRWAVASSFTCFGSGAVRLAR